MRISREEYNRQIEALPAKAYSAVVVDHALYLRNMGALDIASGYASITDICGDTI